MAINTFTLALVASEVNTGYSCYLKTWWQRTSIRGWGYQNKNKLSSWHEASHWQMRLHVKLQCHTRTMPFLFFTENTQGLPKCQVSVFPLTPPPIVLFWVTAMTLHGLAILNLHTEGLVYHRKMCLVRPAKSFSILNRLVRVQCTTVQSLERVLFLAKQDKTNPVKLLHWQEENTGYWNSNTAVCWSGTMQSSYR